MFFWEELKMKKLILAWLVISLVSVAAATTWIAPGPVGYWSDSPNWSNGVPGAPLAFDPTAMFSGASTADCLVVGTQPDFDKLVQGDGGPGGLIRVQNTGSLTATATTSSWSAIGYNNTAHMIVEAGGTVNFGGHLWVALNAGGVGTLDIDGGTVSVAGMLGLGWNGGIGTVNVFEDGLLDLFQIHGDGSSSIKAGSLLNIIGNGWVLLPGDYEAVIAAYVANGRIAGNGILGAVQTDTITNPGYTTVTVGEDPALRCFTRYYPEGTPQYNRWVTLGKPLCWCYDIHQCGDVNGDCFISIADDIMPMVTARTGVYDPCADANYDGFVTIADDIMTAVKHRVPATPPHLKDGLDCLLGTCPTAVGFEIDGICDTTWPGVILP